MRLLVIITVLAMFAFNFLRAESGPSRTPAYWLWAGITARDAPLDGEYYIYQGLITLGEQQTNYKHIGLYSYPLKAKQIYLVYRFGKKLPDPRASVTTFLKEAEKWKRHHVKVKGLQIDFDCGTRQLGMYGEFLKMLRQCLPKQYSLSITGLGDWVMDGDKNSLQIIASNTDEIVFQLYQGRKPIPSSQFYINALKKYPFPFRIGLLARYANKNDTRILNHNSNYKGVIYFIQRGE